MKRLFKSGICVLLVCVMCAAVLAGCGDNQASTTQQNVSQQAGGNKPVFGDDVLVKGDGIELTADTFGYYVYQCAMSEVRKEDPNAEDFSNVDWDKTLANGEKLSDVIKENAVEAMERKAVLVKYGNDNDLGMSNEEKEQIKTSMDQYNEQQGEDIFNTTLRAIGISSIDAYMDLYETETVCSKIKSDFDANRDKYIKNDEKMKEYEDDDNVCVQHILINNNSTKYEDPRKTIDEVLVRAKDGEDFVELMKEFNEDPGQTESGYSFGHGEMVPEFETASFALDYGEISDVVESTYGYHIIKRIVGLAEFQNYLVDEWDLEVNEEALDRISVKDIMDSISEANAALAAAENGGNANG